MSSVFAVIGMRGQGKTTFIKKVLKNRYNYVFDVQNEYQEFNPATHLDPKKFVEECMSYTDTFCVFEEATGFFSGNIGIDAKKMILSARHSRNTYIFCFHSIASIPPSIKFMLNHIVLFKTGDEVPAVKSKYPSLLKPFILLKTKPKYSKLIIDNMK